jgi:hypothetical protein
VISIAVGALEGKLEVYLETAGEGAPDPILVDPTYQGLMKLWGLFQLLGPVPVYLLPEVTDSRLTGLPEGFDVKGLISAAQTLGRGGWHSCPGGEA